MELFKVKITLVPQRYVKIQKTIKEKNKQKSEWQSDWGLQ